MPCQYCLDTCVDDNSGIPQCAYNTGVFSKDNWNCGILNKIRYLAQDEVVYDDSDNSILVLPIPDGGFLILAWYKQRGAVDTAQVITNSAIIPCTLEHAQKVLKQLMEAL